MSYGTPNFSLNIREGYVISMYSDTPDDPAPYLNVTITDGLLGTPEHDDIAQAIMDVLRTLPGWTVTGGRKYLVGSQEITPTPPV
jgi:hypothetical protein